MSSFDYTSRDFATIQEDLLNRAASSLPEWTDRDPSDFLMALIKLWAYEGDILHFYIDRAASESFLATATQRESVLALANLYDYTPNFVASARATVTVYNGTGASVSIPSGTKFSGDSGNTRFNFYTTSDATLEAAQVATLNVKEGILYTGQLLTNTAGQSSSNGLSSQRFSLYHQNVDPNTVKVYVHEGPGATPVEWKRVDRLVTSSANDAVYSLYVTAANTTQVVFGNGVNGRIPPVNLAVTADYAVTSGAAGNIPAGVIDTLNSSTLQGVLVRKELSTEGVGGSDVENISALKAALPRVFRTSRRAVTLSDFSDLALGVQGVAKAVAEYAGTSGTGGSVTVYAAPYQSGYTTASSVTSFSVEQNLRERVHNELMPNAMLGIASVAVPSTIGTTPVYVSTTVYAKDNYVASLVETEVATALANKFSFEEMTFGQVLHIGDFYRTILAVDGVDYAIINDFNITGLGGGLDADGRIPINAYKLARNGGISVTVINGVTAA